MGVSVSATVSLDHFIIENGQAYNGGGIHNNGDLNVSNSIIRNNSVTYSGGGIVNDINSIALILNNTTINNNSATYGGGISNGFGNVILNDTTVRNNSAYHGGGIHNYGSFVLNNSTISNNFTAIANGGGIYEAQGSMTLNNSTVSNNSAVNGYGGGIYKLDGSLILNNATVSNNSAGQTSGGIYNNSGVVTLQNSILAYNLAIFGDPDCFGTIGSAGYNLIGDTTNCDFTAATGDLTNIVPLLGPLQDNGGPTFTHALLIGSPAIDAGNPAGCTDQNGNLLATDQRGVHRPQGTRCDIGSFELEPTGEVGEVRIDIKPGSQTNLINGNSFDTLPVAILSASDFDAPLEVDRTSLIFGRTGDEVSLDSCNTKNGQDVNGDGLLDLVCYFKTRLTGFQVGDTVGILRGQTVNNVPIEGQDTVKIVRK